MEQQEWSVGELASAIGVSVRTLHHYEDIGLLIPSRRTESGHRRYSSDDLQRLTQIVSLRSLGLSLERVQHALGDGAHLTETLRQQMHHVEAEIRLGVGLRDRLRRTLEGLGGGRPIDAEELIRLMEETTTVSDYYSKDDQDFLAERRGALGEEQIKSVQDEWPRLGSQMEQARLAGQDVGDPEVQRLARRWVELVEMFTGGSDSVRQGLARRNSAEGNPLVTSGVIRAETVEFAYRAIALLDPSSP